MITACPFCGCALTRHQHVGEPSDPEDGDAAVCFECGNVSIFVVNQFGGFVRQPTETERVEIEQHPLVAIARQARTQNPESTDAALATALRMMEESNG